MIDEGIGLSAPVAAAVDRAVEAVLELELCVPNEESALIRRLVVLLIAVALS